MKEQRIFSVSVAWIVMVPEPPVRVIVTSRPVVPWTSNHPTVVVTFGKTIVWATRASTSRMVPRKVFVPVIVNVPEPDPERVSEA